MNKDIRYKIEGVSRNVVNQLYDLAEVPVKKRQSINDTADEFVIKLISQLFRSTLKESLERVRLEKERILYWKARTEMRNRPGRKSEYNKVMNEIHQELTRLKKRGPN